MEFMQSWPFMGLMLVLLIALIGVFIWQRNKQDED